MNILDNSSKNVLIKGWEKKWKKEVRDAVQKSWWFWFKDNTCKYSLQFFQPCMPIRSTSEPFQHPWESRVRLQWECLELCTDLHSQEKIFRRKSCFELPWERLTVVPPTSLASVTSFPLLLRRCTVTLSAGAFVRWVSLYDHNHLHVVILKNWRQSGLHTP